MKYVPIPAVEAISDALNFSRPDIQITGGCDVYTTKAAGDDFKLYESIEHELQNQYQALVRLSASLSPPYSSAGSPPSPQNARSVSSAPAPHIDLSRPSPFGSLHQASARKTYKFLIATLNASHPDYDFSHKLRPSDFRKERSLYKVMAQVDTTLHNLRPRRQHYGAHLAPPTPRKNNALAGQLWDSKMWAIIDKDINLKQCEKYSYAPTSDLFEDEEGALWSMHYFFYNKAKKRIVYLYLRGMSVVSHSPELQATAARQSIEGVLPNELDDEEEFDDAYLDDGWTPVRGFSEEVGDMVDL